MRRLNRKQKIVRNLLAALTLLVLAWVWNGCPPLTEGMMLRREARKNLVRDWQVVYREADDTWYDTGGVYYLRSGDNFWCLRHQGAKALRTELCGWEGVAVTPSKELLGGLLAIGDVGAASAELSWRLRRVENAEVWMVTGDWISEDVIVFAPPENCTEEQLRMMESMQGNQWARDWLFDYVLRLYDENGTLLREVRDGM